MLLHSIYHQVSNKFVNNFRETNQITQEANFRLKTSDATTSRLYRLPQLSKEDIPPRPIVSFTDSPTYGLAKELSSLLKPLIGKYKPHVRKSSDFVYYEWNTPNWCNNGPNSTGIKHSQTKPYILSWAESMHRFVNHRPY